MFIETEIYKYGLTIENIVIDYLESNEYEIIQKYNNDNSHDIIVKNIITNKQFNVEIKGCRQGIKTGNFYIEYISHDMPSGINTTKSDILIYVIESNEKYIMYWININYLKNYINTNYNKIKIGKTKSIDSNGNFNGKYNFGFLIQINSNIYHKINEIIKSNQ
jgi:hypothetical protein